MNVYASTVNSPGLLKSVYNGGKSSKPTSQVNDKLNPMMDAVRQRMNASIKGE